MAFTITTVGDGAMATVASLILSSKTSARASANVTLWGRNAARLAEIDSARENRRYLPGIRLPENLRCEANPAIAFRDANLILCAVPTQYIRATLTALLPHVPKGIPIVSVSKGIELETLQRPSQVIRSALAPAGPRSVAALSGPNIASEIAAKKPATAVVAAEAFDGTPDPELAEQIQQLFTTRALRVYRNDDLLGVELAGALKNVIAIAAGILDGMNAGNNAKAALLTRGLVEISRLGLALGARPETFAGLAGLGDLVTTCFSPEGRNRSFGERIGRGEKADDILADMVGVVEGMPTCKSVVSLARSKDVEMPISEGLHAVLYQGRDPQDALAGLMSRELKHEAEPMNP